MTRPAVMARMVTFEDGKLEWLAKNSSSFLWRECAIETLTQRHLSKQKKQ
jgi:hypothetical protein